MAFLLLSAGLTLHTNDFISTRIGAGGKQKKVPNGAIAPFDTVVHGNFVFSQKTRLLLT